MHKKAYRRPKLVVLGNVEQITGSALRWGGGDMFCHHLACNPNWQNCGS